MKEYIFSLIYVLIVWAFCYSMYVFDIASLTEAAACGALILSGGTYAKVGLVLDELDEKKKRQAMKFYFKGVNK